MGRRLPEEGAEPRLCIHRSGPGLPYRSHRRRPPASVATWWNGRGPFSGRGQAEQLVIDPCPPFRNSGRRKRFSEPTFFRLHFTSAPAMMLLLLLHLAITFFNFFRLTYSPFLCLVTALRSLSLHKTKTRNRRVLSSKTLFLFGRLHPKYFRHHRKKIIFFVPASVLPAKNELTFEAPFPFGHNSPLGVTAVEVLVFFSPSSASFVTAVLVFSHLVVMPLAFSTVCVPRLPI